MGNWVDVCVQHQSSGYCNVIASRVRAKTSKFLENTKSEAFQNSFSVTRRNLKEPLTVTFDKHLPLQERLLRIDHIQARRFSKLGGVTLEIATEGIIRHLKACDRMDVNPDTSAVREIIDDALNGRRVFAETSDDRRAA